MLKWSTADMQNDKNSQDIIKQERNMVEIKDDEIVIGAKYAVDNYGQTAYIHFLIATLPPGLAPIPKETFLHDYQ